MDSQIIIHLNKQTLELAEKLSDYKGITLSQLTEGLIKEAVKNEQELLDKFPVADWVLQLGEGPAEQTIRNWKEQKSEYYESKK